MGEIAMAKKTKYAAGIEVESAFGRTDYMYVYEVAPWAYDAVNDWIKVSIESAIPFDLSDDWARELGQVDLARYLGAACGLLNPVHVGITVAGAIVDPRQIRALTALDIVSAAQSGVWSVGRTWALAVATDAVAAQVSNWPALYAMNLTQYISAACGLLNPVHVGVTVAGAIVDPRQIRALTAADIVTADSLSKWGGTALTGRNITLLLDNLDVALSTLAKEKIPSAATDLSAFGDFSGSPSGTWQTLVTRTPAVGKTVYVKYINAWCDSSVAGRVGVRIQWGGANAFALMDNLPNVQVALPISFKRVGDGATALTVNIMQNTGGNLTVFGYVTAWEE